MTHKTLLASTLRRIQTKAKRDAAIEKRELTPKHLRPRCGARTRAGTPCQAPAVWDNEHDRPRTRNGRCRMHGGNCRGAVTPEGKRRCAEALRRYREQHSKR